MTGALDFFGSRWVKNDYELVRWPPDAEKDKAVGIFVAGEEEQHDVPDAAQVSRFLEQKKNELIISHYSRSVVNPFEDHP